jgi:pimeloyl-ACP methyl ester carboxylesterase
MAPEVARESGENVQFPVPGGFTLKASLFRAADASAPAVILVHQLGSSRREWGSFIEALREQADVSVLAIDLRGHGDSTTRDGAQATFERFGPEDFAEMTADVRGALSVVKAQLALSPQRVVFVGSSIGSSAAIRVASEDPKVAAVVAVSPGIDYKGLDTFQPVRARPDLPALFLAGSADKYAAHSAKVLSGEMSAAELHIVEGTADHGVVLLESHPDLSARVIAFVLAHARPRPIDRNDAPIPASDRP